MHHLRHLPPIVRLGVAISCTAGTSGIGTSETLGASCSIVSADKVSQLSVNDDVRVEVSLASGVSLFPAGWY